MLNPFKKSVEKYMSQFFYLIKYATGVYLILPFLVTYAHNKGMCLLMCYWEKTVPRRNTKFHMKTVGLPNVLTWDLDFEFIISF